MARGRPPTGCPKFNPEKQVWEARVSLPSGQRRFVPMPGIAKDDAERAKRMAKIVAERAKATGAVPCEVSETVNEYAERWLDDREAHGITTVGHDRGRLKNHVLPILGLVQVRAPARELREHVEKVVEDLDRKILLDDEDDDHLEWKTASNVWVLVTKMFDDAVNSKRRELRVREDNPTKGVKGPERGAPKAKQYLYPSEFLQLVACPAIGLPFRTLYAVAVYLFARAGELEALTWGDVDLEHRVVHITKAIDRKTGEVKSTKSGETRRVPIHPHLLPLLAHLKAEAEAAVGGETKRAIASERCLWMPDDEDRAILVRQHLQAAGVTRATLFANDAYRKHITFHDLRATGITWMAVDGEDPLRIKQRAGHKSFSTTEGYIREAENLVDGFGDPFPPLPSGLTGGGPISGSFSDFWIERSEISRDSRWSKGGSNTTAEWRESARSTDGNAEKDACSDEDKAKKSAPFLDEAQRLNPQGEGTPEGVAEPPTNPDDTLKAAIKAAVDAGDLARAEALLGVLRSSPKPAAVLALARRRKGRS